MSKRKTWCEQLIIKSREDKAKNLKINNIPILDCINVKREMRCEFLCHCGEKGNKNIRQIVQKSGLFCQKCTKVMTRNKTNSTCMEKYGVPHSLQSEEVKEKSKRTCMEKYGVENPGQSEKAKERKKATMLKKYGVENALQSEAVKEKSKRTCMEKYGVEYVLKSGEVRNKGKATNLEKYGVENPSQSEEVKQKMKETCMKKYGVPIASMSDCVKEKALNTIKKNWGEGITSTTQVPEIKKAQEETCLLNYGVRNPFESKKIQEKIKETCKIKYGHEYANQNKLVKEKIIKTNIKRYGTANVMHNPEIYKKSQKGGYKKKDYKFKTGESVKIQGYENKALDILQNYMNYTHSDFIENIEPLWYIYKSKNNDKLTEHQYHPDILFLRENLIIEVKSKYTFRLEICKNLKKAKSVINKGYRFQFWIFGEKDEFDIIEPKNKFDDQNNNIFPMNIWSRVKYYYLNILNDLKNKLKIVVN